ncbi:UNVERIFIED_CONTAM: hypothetical protein K2H54_050828 [Gekko kuhli]
MPCIILSPHPLQMHGINTCHHGHHSMQAEADKGCIHSGLTKDETSSGSCKPSILSQVKSLHKEERCLIRTLNICVAPLAFKALHAMICNLYNNPVCQARIVIPPIL